MCSRSNRIQTWRRESCLSEVKDLPGRFQHIVEVANRGTYGVKSRRMDLRRIYFSQARLIRGKSFKIRTTASRERGVRKTSIRFTLQTYLGLSRPQAGYKCTALCWSFGFRLDVVESGDGKKGCTYYSNIIPNYDLVCSSALSLSLSLAAQQALLPNLTLRA